MKTLNKITFEIHVKINKLSTELPQVPFFIMQNGKAKVQQITKTKYISTTHSKTIAGGLVNNFEKGKETRLMNHEVNLNKQYQLYGQAGIDEYVAYVMDLNAQLANLQTKVNDSVEANQKNKEDIVAERNKVMDTSSISEHNQYLTRPLTEDEVFKKLDKPTPEEFGWKLDENGWGCTAEDKRIGIWLVNGGEQAYYKAVSEWELANAEPIKEELPKED